MLPDHLVLASASPRRLDLLRQVGLDPEVRSPDVDETRLPGEDVAAMVLFLCSDAGAAISGQAIAVDGHTEGLGTLRVEIP